MVEDTSVLITWPIRSVPFVQASASAWRIGTSALRPACHSYRGCHRCDRGHVQLRTRPNAACAVRWEGLRQGTLTPTRIKGRRSRTWRCLAPTRKGEAARNDEASCTVPTCLTELPPSPSSPPAAAFDLPGCGPVAECSPSPDGYEHLHRQVHCPSLAHERSTSTASAHRRLCGRSIRQRAIDNYYRHGPTAYQDRRKPRTRGARPANTAFTRRSPSTASLRPSSTSLRPQRPGRLSAKMLRIQ